MDESFEKRVKDTKLVIQAAQQINAKREILNGLTDFAAILIESDHKTEATNLLAFVMNHPDIPYDVYDRADDMFIRLESELCPRVIADARADAKFITMRGAIEAAFNTLPDQLPPADSEE